MIDWREDHAFDYLDDLLTTQERDAFELDLKNDGVCVQHLRKAKEFRSLLETSRKEAQDLDWTTIHREINEQITPLAGKQGWRSPWFWAPLLTASVVILAIALPFLTEEPPVQPNAPLVSGANTDDPSSLTQEGNDALEAAWKTLEDGSAIQLSSDAVWTRVETKTNGIHLVLSKGEIRAKVTRAPERPYFRIDASDISVEVLGTEFTVALSESGEVNVKVAHGRVSVSSPESTVILTDGESHRHPPSNNAVTKSDDVPETVKIPATQMSETADESPSAKEENKRNGDRKRRSQRKPSSVTIEEATPVEMQPANAEGAPTKQAAAPTEVAKVEKTETRPDKASDLESKNAQGPQVEVEAFSDPVKQSLAVIIGQIRKGKLHGALNQLKEHRSNHSNHHTAMDAMYLEGYCLYKLGNKEQAMKIWESYEKEVPNGPWLKTVRDWTSPSLPSLSRLK